MFEPEMHYIYFLFITASPPALCAGAYGGAKRKSFQVFNVFITASPPAWSLPLRGSPMPFHCSIPRR